MGMGAFLQKEPEERHAPIKKAQPSPALELRVEKRHGHEAFSERGSWSWDTPLGPLVCKPSEVR